MLPTRLAPNLIQYRLVPLLNPFHSYVTPPTRFASDPPPTHFTRGAFHSERHTPEQLAVHTFWARASGQGVIWAES